MVAVLVSVKLAIIIGILKNINDASCTSFCKTVYNRSFKKTLLKVAVLVSVKLAIIGL